MRTKVLATVPLPYSSVLLSCKAFQRLVNYRRNGTQLHIAAALIPALIVYIWQCLTVSQSVCDVQLEEGILYGSGTPEAKGPPAKRQKRGGRHVVLPHMSDDVDTWAALAEVYQGLGEEHLMHVTYAQHIVRCCHACCSWSAAACCWCSCSQLN